MFSNENASVAPSYIQPQIGGTLTNLVKWELNTPTGKNERLELHFEVKKENGITEVGTIYILNPATGQYTDGTYDERYPNRELKSADEKKKEAFANFQDSMFHIIATYRPDLTHTDLKKIGGSSFTEYVTNTLKNLPANFKELASTWKFIYFMGRGPMTIPKKPNFVMLGKGTFRFNAEFDQVTETAQNDRRTPSAPAEFVTTKAANEVEDAF